MKNVSNFTMFSFALILVFHHSAYGDSGKCTDAMLRELNRDDTKPEFPLKDDIRAKSYNILQAHEVLRRGLQQYLEFKERDLGTYLSHIIETDQTFVDEYDKEIRSYYKVFNFIWEQYNETLCQNYAIKQFDKDKLDLCSVARYLSHQPKVGIRRTIMKEMGDALQYRCHPCTPYKRKEFSETVVPNTDDSSFEGITPEESLKLCKDFPIHGQRPMSTSTVPAITTSIDTNPPSTASTFLPITTTISSPSIGEEFCLLVPADLWFDYSPCNYYKGDVVCDQVSLQEVQRVFRQTITPALDSVELTLIPYAVEGIIEQNILFNKRSNQIILGYPNGTVVNNSLSLKVNANAFKSTKNYTKIFKIHSIECSQLDLSFLLEFDQLSNLTFSSVLNIHLCFGTLPPLPSLTILSILNWININEIYSFPYLANGLKVADFIGDRNNGQNDSLNDAAVDRILSWLLISSTNTLEDLAFVRMGLVTQVPPKIPAFKALKNVWLHTNGISSIKSGALSFSTPVSLLNLEENKISEIEPGAFKGNFKDAFVSVWNNKLTQFDESVFGSMLNDMSVGEGVVYATGNSIDCSDENICHMAWLSRYELDETGLRRVFYISCSSNYSFSDLDSNSYSHCPGYYSTCIFTSNEVTCDQVSIDDIKKAFLLQTITPTFDVVTLILRPYVDVFIPANLLASKRITDLSLRHPYEPIQNGHVVLKVDTNAFRSTKDHTRKFFISFIDCTTLDFSFLSGFNRLENFKLANIKNIHFCLPTLPPLPNLIRLQMDNCVGMHLLHYFPTLTNGLKMLILFGHENYYDEMWDDQTISRIMDWLLISSANTLKELQFEDLKHMTQFPPQISSFKALNSLWLFNTNVHSVKAGIISFSVPVLTLGIEASGLKEIEAGAFQGDFKDAKVHLNDNSLTRFEESVFGTVLWQMSYGKGFVNATGNPIDCGENNICHLSWLRRYKPGAHLDLDCSNGNSLAYAQSTGLNQCA